MCMKLLHTADIHIGVDAHGRLDAATGLNTRLLDFQNAFEFMVEHALKEDIDAFIFAGDAYRTADPTPTQQRLFAECLKPIADAGIPIVMIVGNHDHPVSFGKASALDIFEYVQGDVHLFNRPEVKRIETKAGPLQIVALPWPIRSLLMSREAFRGKTPLEIRTFVEEFYGDFVMREAANLDPALPAVLVGHFSVQGAELGGSERTSLIAHEPKFLVSQLAVPPLDYVALGHIHRHQDMNPGGIPVIYSSSIERVSFKEEGEPKGFVMIDIDASVQPKKTTWRHIHTPARRFVTVDVDARQSPNPTETILNAIAAKDIADAVVRVRYQVDEAQAPLVDGRRIREALAPAYTIAAVDRTVEPVERQRRTVVTRESSLKDALTHYVAQHEHLQPLEKRLLDAALALEAELDGGREAEQA